MIVLESLFSAVVGPVAFQKCMSSMPLDRIYFDRSSTPRFISVLPLVRWVARAAATH